MSGATRVLALGGLFGDAEHGADLGPGLVVVAGGPDSIDELGVDLLSSVGELGDVAEVAGVDGDEVVGRDLVRPFLERRGSIRSGLGRTTCIERDDVVGPDGGVRRKCVNKC